MNKEINLKNIIDPNMTSLSYYNGEVILNAMREACEQAIDLCAENAEADVIFYLSSPSPSTEDYEVSVIKQSILDVKSMIIHS